MFYITVFNIFYHCIYLVLLCIVSSFSILLLSSFLTEKEKICQMQEHYERLLKKAKDELEVLRKQVNMTHQELLFTQKWYAYCLTICFLSKWEKVKMVDTHFT